MRLGSLPSTSKAPPVPVGGRDPVQPQSSEILVILQELADRKEPSPLLQTLQVVTGESAAGRDDQGSIACDRPTPLSGNICRMRHKGWDRNAV